MNDTPTPEEGSKTAAKRVERDRKNGVTKPEAGTKTGRVWELCDEISAREKRPALRGELLEAGLAEGMSKGTLATQYGKWCTYHGVSQDQLREARSELSEAKKEAAKAEKAAKKAAKEKEEA